jgi:hypothetical protein
MVNHLRQICQQRDERVKQLENELDDLKQKLQQELMERQKAENKARPQTASVGSCTEDLPTTPFHSNSDTNINRLVVEEKGNQNLSKHDVAPGTPNRRNVPLKNGLQSPLSRNSRAGYTLPPTPPSAGRQSRGRRNSTSSR